MSSCPRILIVGGYGKVGLQVAARLADSVEAEIIVAGRNQAAASAAASALGGKASGLAVDVASSEAVTALQDLTAVVVCVDQHDTEFATACLSRGIHYVDITASHRFLLAAEKLDHMAWQCGATGLLSVGVAPGLTNLLAAQAKRALPSADRVDILLELGLGDLHGKAAIEWMLDKVDEPMEPLGDSAKVTRSFGASRKLRFPGQKPKTAYLFAFPERHTIPRTLEIPRVSTWLRFSSRFVTWLAAQLARKRILSVLVRPFFRRALVALLMRASWGSSICGVAVRAEGSGDARLELGVVGRDEAQMTAIVAAESVRQLLLGGMPFGVYHSEEVVELSPVLDALRDALPGLIVSIPSVTEPAQRLTGLGGRRL